MKIFLCSTNYDLMDFRALVVDRINERKKGHEVLYHESPTFPAKLNLHTHDQCILAVEESDIVLCILDKRYGGKYSGEFKFNDLKIKIKGHNIYGKEIRPKIEIENSELSITWCELIRAYERKIPVITFARQRLLDEKETRRRNQYLKTFRPAYAEKNELFDLIDWITKQDTNNWIVSFTNIVDFEKKLIKYLEELEETYKVPADSEIPVKDLSKICIVVEGEIDRIFVNHLINKLKLQNYFVIIPSYGKYRTLNYFENTIAQYATIFDEVIVLMDSDTKSHAEMEYINREFRNKIEENGLNNISFYLAVPEIESWIAAGLNQDVYNELNGNVDKKTFNKNFVKSNISNISRLLRNDFDFRQAMNINPDFHMFVEKLLEVGKKQELESHLNRDSTLMRP